MTSVVERPYELYFRNPYNYHKELLEAGHYRFAFDHGILIKRKIDLVRWAEATFGEQFPWTGLAIGEQGSALYDRTSESMDNPIGVFPTWNVSEGDRTLFEATLEHPWGDDESAYGDLSVPSSLRPLKGQRNMVVVYGLESGTSAAGRSQYAYISEMQDSFPDVTIHLHNSYSYNFMFGLKIRSADVDPRTSAANGQMVMPNGRWIKATKESMLKQIAEIRAMGYGIRDLEDPRTRTMFNIHSADYASKTWKTKIAPPSRSTEAVRSPDVEVSNDDYTPGSVTLATAKPKGEVRAGDKIQCNTCSLKSTCKFYREGSVCTLPDSQVAKLSDYFDTRDSTVIMAGLQRQLRRQADRLERREKLEEQLGDMDPEIDKQADKLFKNTVVFAKLVDPTLSKPTVQVNVGTQGQVSGAPTPRAQGIAAVRALVELGYTKDDLMKDKTLIDRWLAGEQIPRMLTAIDAEVEDE